MTSGRGCSVATVKQFSRWQRAHRLEVNSVTLARLLERNLVTEARSGKDLVRIAAMYQSVEAARVVTTALFQLAQTASMAHQVPNLRGAEISVW